jgi:sialidase-1
LQHSERRGRLIVPCDHRERIDGEWIMFSHVVYSDDHGATWTLGGSVDRHTDECQVVELAGGELLINMRNYWGTTGKRPDVGNRRATSRSRDGGLTWSLLAFDETLIEPICQASLISLPSTTEGRPMLAFCNPASTGKRQNLTLRISTDDGKSWNKPQTVDPGPAAYSSIVALSGKELGILYERGESRELRFVVVPVP